LVKIDFDHVSAKEACISAARTVNLAGFGSRLKLGLFSGVTRAEDGKLMIEPISDIAFAVAAGARRRQQRE
jgi:hypothetical protein